jgi:branched-subunit amino acid aminotransferase/4-amino-4-deoxychorismate lyase
LPEDLGFRQGVTAVERLRTYHGRPFSVPRHLDRWQQTTAALHIPSAASSRMEHLLSELCQRNQSLIAASGDVGITIFATPGIGTGTATLGLHLNTIDHAMVEDRREKGQSLQITTVQQPANACWPRSAKVRSRLHYYLADQFARQQQPNAIGLLLDADGSVTETSVANVAIVESGCIVSPQPDQVLGGVTQSVASDLSLNHSIRWTHDRITTDRLQAADEVLLMGTDTGIWFASHINQTTVGNGSRGPLCERLQTLFAAKCMTRQPNPPN